MEVSSELLETPADPPSRPGGVCGSRKGGGIRHARKRFPEFAEALACGRERSYAEIAASLFERAMGWSHPAAKIFPPRKEGGNPVVVEYIERFPPDTQAAMFVLTNREPDLWSNKQTIEHNVSNKLADRLEAARLRMIERLQAPTIEATVAETMVQPDAERQDLEKL
jgi:hypothetical protein